MRHMELKANLNQQLMGPHKDGASPWDGGLCPAGAHPCRAPPSPGASTGNHRYFIPRNEHVCALISFLSLSVFKLPSLAAWSFPDFSSAGVVHWGISHCLLHTPTFWPQILLSPSLDVFNKQVDVALGNTV